jgi:hypothetical protein
MHVTRIISFNPRDVEKCHTNQDYSRSMRNHHAGQASLLANDGGKKVHVKSGKMRCDGGKTHDRKDNVNLCDSNNNHKLSES